MKNEMKRRGEPDVNVIIEKMKRTKEYRRIFCQERSTSDVLQEFPALRLRQLVNGSHFLEILLGFNLALIVTKFFGFCLLFIFLFVCCTGSVSRIYFML